MAYVKYDAGKGRRTNGDEGDCQVRALHTASGLSYGAAWDALYALQGKYRSNGFNITLYLDSGELGVVRKLSFPAKAGKKRMTATEFVRRYPKGNYILQQAHHVVGVEDGVVYDRFDSTIRCVYVAWEVLCLPRQIPTTKLGTRSPQNKAPPKRKCVN
jgi:hypothetical protein